MVRGPPPAHAGAHTPSHAPSPLGYPAPLARAPTTLSSDDVTRAARTRRRVRGRCDAAASQRVYA